MQDDKSWLQEQIQQEVDTANIDDNSNTERETNTGRETNTERESNTEAKRAGVRRRDELRNLRKNLRALQQAHPASSEQIFPFA